MPCPELIYAVLPLQIKFVDSHNGWGLTALHIAVFQGAVNTGGAAYMGFSWIGRIHICMHTGVFQGAFNTGGAACMVRLAHVVFF